MVSYALYRLPILHVRLADAGRLIAEMRCGVDEDTAPAELDNKQIVSLHQLLHEAKFKDPDKDHLSPAGGHQPHPPCTPCSSNLAYLVLLKSGRCLLCRRV